MFLHPQHHHHHTTIPSRAPPMDASGLARHGKRKAADAPEGNERLSKRLSLLRLENGNTRLYVPVEGAARADSASAPSPVLVPAPATALPTTTPVQPPAGEQQTDNVMQVDDTKYKVYIYDIDKELASDDEDQASGVNTGATAQHTRGSGSDSDGSVVLLPDLDKHLRTAARDVALNGSTSSAAGKLAIPAPVRANDDGELAGMQLVLYNDPSSLSVPREQDSVRMAILDARARIRARQREEQEEEERARRAQAGAAVVDDEGAMADDDSMGGTPMATTPMATTPLPVEGGGGDDEDDAMELD